jgi:CheY-like chemotaxis protein
MQSKTAPDKKPKQGQAYSLKNFRILSVEDYPFMADLISSMLREFGIGHIMQAVNAQEAREILTLFNSESQDERNAIDIVVVDWLMPDGDGPELLRWIREHRKSSIKFLPTILCSAYASEDVVGMARDGGANEALVKPVSAIKLAKRILHVVDNPRPYIKAPDFFGPDRRRKEVKWENEERRKMQADAIKEFHE